MLFIARSFVIIIITLISGCVLIDPFFAKEDSCEKSASICQLKQNDIKLKNLNKGEFVDVEICACRPWNRSGISVRKKEKYIFEVNETSEWIDKNTKSDPRTGWINNDFYHQVLKFFSSPRTEVADIYALVGTVGKDDKNAFAVLNCNPIANGESFSCKNHDPITIMKGEDNEELFFYANDREGYYYNNKGKLNLRITIVDDSHENANNSK